MSLPRYPEYKPSGAEWLGEVPGHWDIVPLKHVITQIESGVSVNATDDPATEREIGVLKTSCVYSGQFDAGENKVVIETEIDRVTCPLKKGTLIVSRMNTPDLVGAAGLVKFAPTNIYLPDRLWQVSFSSANPAFVYYWAQSVFYRAQIRVACAGTSSSMQNLGQDQFRSFSFPNPPQIEQQIIAAFLGRETGKIDALIAEQQRLVELLAEKRQAVISHAVTKGLNPNAPMKNSGIEWLGEVPEHWEVVKVRYLVARIGSGKTPSGGSETYVDEGVMFLRSQNVYDEGLQLDDVVYISEDVDESMAGSRVIQSDILLNITGASIGRSCVVPKGFPPANVNQHVCIIRLNNIDHVPFVGWSFKSIFIKKQIDFVQNGAAREGLNFEQIAGLCIAIPPDLERQIIAAFLDNETAKFNNLTTEANRAIALLQERRSALISAAVTGKIDVRGLGAIKEAA